MYKVLLMYLFNLVFIPFVSFAQIDVEHKYKTVGATFFTPCSPIIIEEDSVLLNGYLVFEAHKNPDEKLNLHGIKNYQFDIYYLTNIEDIKQSDKRVYYNNKHSFFSSYADSDSIGGFITLGGKIEFTPEYIPMFEKYRLFYESYSAKRVTEDTYFLMNKIETNIFDSPSVNLWKLNNDSVSYFVFETSFYAAIMSYCAYYESNLANHVDSKLVFVGEIKSFLPVSKATEFKPVPNEYMKESGFSRSDWYPDIYTE